eukprot:scaffold23241_cov56-Attheya_sp.AAC.3
MTAWTLIHKSPKPIEFAMYRLNTLFGDYDSRLRSWRKNTSRGAEDWPETDSELTAARIDNANIVISLKELQGNDWLGLEEEIQVGLKDLAARFRPNPFVPPVPMSVWKDAMVLGNEEMYDYGELEETWSCHYPILDEDTALAVIALSDVGMADHFPQSCMLGVAAHFVSQAWTDDEFRQWFQGMRGMGGSFIRSKKDILKWPAKTTKLTRKKRAKLLAYLTWDVLNYSSDIVRIQNLEHTAMRMHMVPLQEMKMEAEKAGIAVASYSTRASLVLAVIEHIFEDVLLPTHSSSC